MCMLIQKVRLKLLPEAHRIEEISNSLICKLPNETRNILNVH